MSADVTGAGAAGGRGREERGAHGHDAHAHQEHGGDAAVGHASVGFYWLIGGILTVITALEVAVFYIEALAGLLVPILLVLSAAKFVLVVMFFMHLKYDSKIFTGVFLAGLILATFVVLAMVTLYHFLPRFEA